MGIGGGEEMGKICDMEGEDVGIGECGERREEMIQGGGGCGNRGMGRRVGKKLRWGEGGVAGVMGRT